MPTIRPLEREDLQAVVAITHEYLPGRADNTAFLTATLLDHPWADPELPSLVAVDDEDGGIVGFIASQVRRLRFGDRELRAVCCSHLTVSRERRAGAAGALLLGKLMAGEQDVTYSDSATDVVARMWRTFGGHVDHARACDWELVVSRSRWAGGVVRSLARRREIDRTVVPVAALPAQVLGRRALGRAFPPLPEGVAGEPATPAQIVEHLPAMTRRTRLRVDHDEAHLAHVFRLIEGDLGRVVSRIVRRAGRPVGWYAYLPRPGAASRLLHLQAIEREVGSVFAELFEHARSEGSAVLTGRMEPHLESPLRERMAVLGFARQPIVHARDPEVLGVLGDAGAVLTQLDSEWYVT